MSQDDYLVHISELPADVEKQDIIDFFRKYSIENVDVQVIKS
jgi:hypothetical protein